MDQMLNQRIAAVKAADAINATETPAALTAAPCRDIIYYSTIFICFNLNIYLYNLVQYLFHRNKLFHFLYILQLKDLLN